jgi:N-methylhydantoinase A
LHAADLAAELQIPRVIVPEAPGLFSALGLLWADLRADFMATARRNLDASNAPSMQAQVDRLEAEASAWLEREAVPSARRRLLRSADMRYPLQNYEINVTLPPGRISASWLKRAREAFHAAHEQLYSYCDRAEQVQLVNLRVSAIGVTGRAQARNAKRGSASPRAAQKSERPVHFQELQKTVACPIYERDLLLAGNCIRGPAVVEQADSTIVIPPSFEANVDGHGRLIMTRGAAVSMVKTTRTRRR